MLYEQLPVGAVEKETYAIESPYPTVSIVTLLIEYVVTAAVAEAEKAATTNPANNFFMKFSLRKLIEDVAQAALEQNDIHCKPSRV